MTTGSTPVAVTGATGFVGSRVARLLDQAGIPQRLLARARTALAFRAWQACRDPQTEGADTPAATLGYLRKRPETVAGVSYLTDGRYWAREFPRR